MSWTKIKPIKKDKLHIGCAVCSTAALTAPLEMIICVGFGAAYVEKDGIEIYDGESEFQNGKEPKTLQFFEDLAKKDPDHDWRVIKFGPMHGETFQRHGDNLWVCIESNEGFA